jgi:hypothetical protein
MIDWSKRVFAGSLLGAALGVLLGLGLARILWPISPPPSPTYPTTRSFAPTPSDATPTLTPLPVTADRRDDEIVLVSALYALDGDLARAKERLAALDLDDPAQAVADLALQHASAGHRQLATDLATLASALGQEQGELLAYVATATPTHTPLPTYTATLAPTATPLPTATFTPTPLPTPAPTSTPVPTRRPPTRQPATATPLPPAATPLPLVWDHRVDLLSPPIRLVAADVEPGQQYWRLVRLEWRKANEGGNTLLYINALNENGRQVMGQKAIVEHGIQEVLYIQPGGDYATNYPMANTLNSYIVFVGGDLPSDRVTGLGLGEWLGGMDHNTFVLVFQRSKK